MRRRRCGIRKLLQVCKRHRDGPCVLPTANRSIRPAMQKYEKTLEQGRIKAKEFLQQFPQ